MKPSCLNRKLQTPNNAISKKRMDIEKIRQLLVDVKLGKTDIDQALDRLRVLPYENIDHSRVDTHRSLRQGIAEVIYCENKTTEQVLDILKRLSQQHDRVLATRMAPEMAVKVQAQFPKANYNTTSRLLTLCHKELPPSNEETPYVLVISAGTSDLPVAEEAVQTATFLGSRVKQVNDVGVAGLHRLLDQQNLMLNADVIISIAGMEGALTSVVGGLVSCPVIGVPTSVGYGASFQGLAALLAMLNSCATGVAVMNIDNGFGAGVYAHLILRRIQK